MAKVELHQLSDYQLRTGNLAFALISGTIAHIAIPQSGIVKSVSACIQTVHISLPGLITFEVGGVTLKLGGTTATMTIPDAGSTVGDVHIIEFDATTSTVFEAEDGDVILDGSVLEIISDGEGSQGEASFVVTVGR